MEKKLIKRWEGKKKGMGQKKIYWYELRKDVMGFSFQGNDSGGSLGLLSHEKALAFMQSMIDAAKLENIYLREIR